LFLRTVIGTNYRPLKDRENSRFKLCKSALTLKSAPNTPLNMQQITNYQFSNPTKLSLFSMDMPQSLKKLLKPIKERTLIIY